MTGAGSGLGREIALGFSAAGATVVAADLDLAAAEQTAKEIGSHEPPARAVLLDVRDSASVERAVTGVERLDILVNAAGVGGWGATETYSDALWQEVIAVNLTGTFNCCRAASVSMLSRGEGSIVNIASTLGLVGLPGAPAYVASKGGVVQLTRALAVEFASRGVRVNALAPSTFETPLVLRNRLERPEVYERLLASTPLGRFGDPAEIVGPALFLASRAASMVTGHILAVDGGYVAG